MDENQMTMKDLVSGLKEIKKGKKRLTTVNYIGNKNFELKLI